jgi:hypothetical protein
LDYHIFHQEIRIWQGVIMSEEKIVVTINRRNRTMVFPVNERDRLRDILKDRIWWDRRSNRWAGRGDVSELKQILEAQGYEVKLVGPR